jgi:hypothetical protein
MGYPLQGFRGETFGSGGTNSHDRMSDSPATALRYPHGNLDPRHRQRNQRRLTLEMLSAKVGP